MSAASKRGETRHGFRENMQQKAHAIHLCLHNIHKKPINNEYFFKK